MTLETKNTTFFSSALVNYVEPVEISGFIKTAFYTEINTNFNTGDKVFIVNGNYDSNEKIESDKYTQYTDGYKVIGQDGCRIILDIDWTGALPYNISNPNDFIIVTHVQDQRGFDYVNTLTTNGSNYIKSKFYGITASYTNNIIFAATAFNGSTSWTGVTASGFWFRNDDVTPNTWINISSIINTNGLTSSIPNNGNLYILGEDFKWNGVNFKQRSAYEFKNNKWVENIKLKKPLISKLNFRSGTFKGTHNDGIFGSSYKENNWNSAVWNSGILYNTIWQSGIMNSKSKLGDKSNYAIFSTTQSITQIIDYSNNKGFGYNFIYDSVLLNGEFNAGNFINTNIGSGTFSAMENYFGTSQSSNTKLYRANTELCDINNTILENSLVSRSSFVNSHLLSSKVVSSEAIESVSIDTQINSDSGIKVKTADIWSYVTTPSSSSLRGIIKLYINEEDIDKIDFIDSFYISKINKDYILNSLNDDLKILMPLETRYFLDTFYNQELSSNEIIVSIKTKNENNWKVVAKKNPTAFTNIITSNTINSASIDIDCDAFGYYLDVNNVKAYMNYKLGPITPDNIAQVLANTWIENSDYRSGYINNSIWKSGSNLNYYQNIIKKLTNTTLDINPITINSNLGLSVKILSNPVNHKYDTLGMDVKKGDYIWINSVDYIIGTSSVSIADRYLVTSVGKFLTSSPAFLQLSLLPSGTSSVTFISNNLGGYFSSKLIENNNYASIHKLLIDNSTISSALFKRTGLNTSIIENEYFNNNDALLTPNNINILRLVNLLIKDNNITIKNGLLYKSHITNGDFQNGIVYNSIWNGATFSSGLFKSSTWLNGQFQDGKFIDSNTTTLYTLDYDLEQRYKVWYNGTFNGGEFNNSIWLNGTFNTGVFSKSSWYGGIWNGGVLGSNKYGIGDTNFGGLAPFTYLSATTSYFYGGIVNNATIGGSGYVHWYGGKFNSGEFTSNILNGSIWYDGEFNGGLFSGLARWKGGKFNGGKFHSHHGWQLNGLLSSSTASSDWAWEGGIFNAGEFGNANGLTNSTWYGGEFNSGIFQGRIWNNGVFSNGRFVGSGVTSSAPNDYVQSFTNSFFGLWKNGWVNNGTNDIKNDGKILTEVIRKRDLIQRINTAVLTNVLWLSGTFSHSFAEIDNSIWLDGQFIKGNFKNSYFNPYVDRTYLGGTYSFSSLSVWKGGDLYNSKFYFSDWESGNFYSGEMTGARWKAGTWWYGNANNIYWESGVWKNGIWNGTPFLAASPTTPITTPGTSSIVSNYVLNPGFEHDILVRIASIEGNNNVHLINAFSATQSAEILSDPNIDFGLTSDLTFASESLYANINSDWFSIFYYEDLYTGTLPVFAPPQTVFYDNTVVCSVATSSFPIYVIAPASFYPIGGSNLATDLIFTKPNVYASYSDNLIQFQVTIEIILEANTNTPGPDDNQANFTISYPGGLINDVLTINPVSSLGGIVWYKHIKKTYNISVNGANTGNKKLFIKKNFGNGRLHITKVEFNIVVASYDNVNNTQYPALPINATWSSVISFPNNLTLSLIADSYLIPLSFGNGKFKSGIWENGVWNNGWRLDETSKPYVLVDAVQISDKNWNVTLVELNFNTNLSFSIGDKVSIGNIIGMDINGKRKLIKDIFTVIAVSIPDKTITCSVDINFPIRGIITDTLDNTPYTQNQRQAYTNSSTHINYVTKNVWMNGAFLNGYFSGVWLNGLVKGKPMITKFENTQWVDGEINGGHFKSSVSSANLVGTSGDIINWISNNYNYDSNVITYNTGLIQNMTFYDNNTSLAYQFGYDTWLDLNYVDESQTNIYKDTTYWSDEAPNYLETTLTNPNLNGFITYDVLSSRSTFRNGYDLNTNTYNLGTKYQKFVDHLEGAGEFSKLFSKTKYPSLGLSNFYDDTWTIKSILSLTAYPGVQTGGLTYSGSQLLYPDKYSLENYNDNTLNITTTTYSTGVIDPDWYLNVRNYIFLDNGYSKNIPDKRYSVIEWEVQSWTGFAGPGKYVGGLPSLSGTKYWPNAFVDSPKFYPPAINFSIFSATWSVSRLPANHLLNNNKIKREYFWNRQSLLMQFVGGDLLSNEGGNYPMGTYPLDLKLDNIYFYEVDMIPFFQYANWDYINVDIQAPYYVTYVPPIDYNNQDFNLLNSITIQITSTQIVAQTLSLNPSVFVIGTQL